jgi:hypothetical protein
MPLPHVRQSVPPALQLAGFVQLVVVAAGQVPLLHVRALVLVLPVHDIAPHDVVFALLVSPEQTGVPVVQEIVPPVLQALPDEHAMPCEQVPHAPSRQNSVDPLEGPQLAPSATLVPRSLHTGAPLVHTYDPLWHLLAGVHIVPAAQATHALLLLQTMPVPHELPAVLSVPSMHADTPVVQDVTPFLHRFGLVVQDRPAVQLAQVPALQTRFVPQLVPFASSILVSVQVAAPVAHDCVPL